jgi:alkylation response protein AidB-like acyl-CoA dehydrogenase
MSRNDTDVIALSREFAAREIADAVKDDDRYPDVPFREALYDRARGVGFLSLLLPEEFGGAGATTGALAEALAVISETDAAVAAVVLSQAFAHQVLMGAGRGDLARDGELIATTLYDDPLDLSAGIEATRKGDSYGITGDLDYVVLAPVASSFLLPVLLDGEEALFLCGKGAGLVVGEPLLTLGLRACPVADVRLEKVEGTLVAAGDAMRTAYRDAVEGLRGSVAAIHAGIIAGSLREATAYARERYQGWKQIIDHGQIRAYLGRMAASADVAGELFRAAADGRGQKDGLLASSVQLLVGEMAVESATNGVQILGGSGYMDDFGQAKRMRDAKQAQGIFGRKDLLVQDLFKRMAGL